MLLLSVTIPTTSQQSFPLPMTIPWSDSIKVGRVVIKMMRKFDACTLQSNEYLCTSVPVPHNATYIGEHEHYMK